VYSAQVIISASLALEIDLDSVLRDCARLVLLSWGGMAGGDMRGKPWSAEEDRLLFETIEAMPVR
jgi:hypothetical protein